MTAIYVASKSTHGEMWRDWRALGFDIIATWIDESGPGETGDHTDLWDRCITEAVRADCLIAYHEPGEQWKGAYVEIGAHLATGGLVFLVGDPPGSWVNHANVVRVAKLDTAFILAASLATCPRSPAS